MFASDWTETQPSHQAYQHRGGDRTRWLDFSELVRPIAVAKWIWGVGQHATEMNWETTMYHLMMNLPMVGTLGVAAMLAGPLARLPIDIGAWVLERSLSGRLAEPSTGGFRGQND